MYTHRNFKTKKALRDAIAAGEQLSYYEPGIGAGREPRDGRICVEGPHYPAPHTWYAEVEVKDGFITRITR